MASTRFDLEIFNSGNDSNFGVLRCVQFLFKKGLIVLFDEDPKANKEKEEGSSSSSGDMRFSNNKAHNTIILHLQDEMLREVAKEEYASGLQAKLEELFLEKSLTNRLYMKKP